MKKLIALAFVSALFVSAQAQETDPVDDAVSELDNAPAAKEPVRSALWPAFFAFCEWPETPDLVGLRITIPFSTRQECVTGVDLGLWGECFDFEGCQLNLIRNKVRDSFGGLQVGLYNSVSRGDLFGIQIGLWNQSNSFRGLQAGLVNITGDAQGFQVGLINRAESMYGFQVGLINVIRDAEVPVLPLMNIGF